LGGGGTGGFGTRSHHGTAAAAEGGGRRRANLPGIFSNDSPMERGVGGGRGRPGGERMGPRALGGRDGHGQVWARREHRGVAAGSGGGGFGELQQHAWLHGST